MLGAILEKSKHPLFNALCSEALWKHYHKKEYAEKAIINYNILAEKESENEFAPHFYMGVLRVYSKIKQIDFNYQLFFDRTILFIKSRYNIADYCNSFILKLLVNCGYNLEIIKSTYYEIIEHYENNNDYYRAINYIEDLISLKEQVINEKINLSIRIANNYEKMAKTYDWKNPQLSYHVVHFVQEAMNWWEKSKAPNYKQERERLAKSIIPVKKLIRENMQRIKIGTVDLRDWANLVKDVLEEVDLKTAIYLLCDLIKLESSDSIFNEFKNNGESGFLFFKSCEIDKEGRKKSIIPPPSIDNKEKSLPFIEKKAREKYDRTVFRIKVMQELIFERFKPREIDLEFLTKNNGFVQLDRINTIKKGLIAGFGNDFSTAMHLLMPQNEHAIRCIAEECGAVTYKTDKNGIEECLSLESILNLPEVEDCLDETLLFNLKLFFTSPYAYGMRNEISHGLMSEQELNSTSGVIVWWFTLKLCCIFSSAYTKLIKRKNEKNKTD